MKRVIRGKEYDTETAELIYGPASDDLFYTESLYRSPKCQLFIVITSDELGHYTQWKLLQQKDAQRWLDRFGAPREAYETLGITIELG